MTRMSILLAALLAAELASADAIVRAARDERARRQRLAARATVLDNRDLSSRTGGQPAVTTAAPATRGPALLAERDESEREEWQERMREALRRIDGLEKDVDFQGKQVMILQRDLVVPNDPLAEHNRKAELDQALARRAQLERELVQARLEPARIREEARRAGVPPGWVR